MVIRDKRIALCFVILMILASTVQASYGFGNSDDLFKELACEGYPIVIRCPGTDVIRLVSAMYGRQNSETCSTTPEQSRNTNCQLPQALDIASLKCNNKTQCKLPVSSETFPDPCQETHKYLEVGYECVKYMFGCPGALNGIGSNTTFSVQMSPEAGSWSKDPLFNLENVFYVSKSQQIVQEYDSIDSFVSGENPAKRYALPSRMEGTSYVVYDRFLYYIKAGTRKIIKYSFLLNLRVKEGTLPGRYYPHGSNYRNHIQLAVDEKGLWAVYVGSSDSNFIDISRINMKKLTIEQTWKTTYLQSSVMHSFMICGVLYVIGTRSGEVDYLYNTNLSSGREKLTSIGFDQSGPLSASGLLGRHGRKKPHLSRERTFSSQAGQHLSPRSFRSYNFSSVQYNPRDRLLYAWEASTSRAVYYNLHFVDIQGITTSRSITTTTTTTTTTIITSRKSTTAKEPVQAAYCPFVHRSGMSWPRTKVETYAAHQCSADSIRYVKWMCVMNITTSEPQWDPKGPDFSDCDAGLNNIEDRLDKEHINVFVASTQLHRRLTIISQTQGPTEGQVLEVSGLIRKIASVALQRQTSLNSTLGRKLADSVTSSVNILLRGDDAWQSMESHKRYFAVNEMITSLEDVGYLLVQSLAADQKQTAAIGVVEKSKVSMHAIVEASSSNNIISSSLSREDQVVLPTDNLSPSKGVFSAVFVFYDNLAELMDAPAVTTRKGNWKVKSKVVSVVIGRSDQHKQLLSPVRMTMKTHEAANLPRQCAFWKFEQNVGRGHWSTDGCHVTSSNSSHTECSCDHVTSFAVLVNVAEEDEREILNVITIVGISVSLFCLLFSFVTFFCFSKLQNDRNTVHKNLCACLLVAEFVFLFGINRTENQLACSIIAGVLHYSFLAASMWVALEGFQLYVMLIEVFESKSKWKWYYLVGYGIPLVIVGVSAAVDSSGYGIDSACWLKADSGFIWSFVGPVCTVIFCDMIFLGITLAKIYRHSQLYSDLSKIRNIKMALRGAAILVFLLATTWAFGILWISDGTVIMACLFSLFNAFQGLFIFFYHCVFQRKVRKEYYGFFARFKCCDKESPNFGVTSSMSFTKQYPSSRFSSPNSAGVPVNVNPQLQRMLDEARNNPPDSAALATQDFSYRENPRSGFRQVDKNRSSSLLDRPLAVNNFSSTNHEGLHAIHDPRSSDGNMEDAYDHLQRHCHHRGEHPVSTGCHHTHHAGGIRRAVGDPLPPTNSRSQTINFLNPERNHQGVPDKEDVQPSWNGKKASTLANMQGRENIRNIEHPQDENAYLLPSKRYREAHEMDRKASNNSRVPESLHPQTRQRRSMTSSGSDDPIVNDYSASSSAGSKPSSVNGTINASAVGVPSIIAARRWQRGRCPVHHNEEYIERDENDREVELLTEADKLGSAECLYSHTDTCPDQQRDSAFYPSMQELESSPLTRYSSNSSPCSQEHPKDLHRQWLHRSYDDSGSNPANVLSNQSVPNIRNFSDNHFAEQERYTDHRKNQHSGVDSDHEHPDALRHNRSMMTQPNDYGNQYDPHPGSNAPNRMMTCL